MDNLADLVRFSAQRWPDREAVVFGDLRWTFLELSQAVKARADWLANIGIAKGDSVVTIGHNSTGLLTTYLAIAAAGAVNVPLNTMSTEDDALAVLHRSNAVAVIADRDFNEFSQVLRGTASSVKHWVDLVEIGDPTSHSPLLEETTAGGAEAAMIIFTSGSTGTPKGCIKSHANLIAHVVNTQLAMPRTASDRELYAIPLAGIGLVNFALIGILAGSALVLTRFKASDLMTTVRDEAVSTLFLPPTMLHAVLEIPGQQGINIGCLKTLYTGYEISERLRAAIWDRFGPIVRFGYGSSEGSISYAPATDFMDDQQCVGQVSGLDELRVVDPEDKMLVAGETGEIVVRGPSVFTGYLGDPEMTEATIVDGWYHTGDLGWLDDHARLHFAGRLKDMIKTGGMNVAAAEVEQVISRHPAVVNVAVVGLPDDRWGEAVVAAVVLSDYSVTQAELDDFASANLAGFKRPKRYVMLSELPVNPTGKIAKGVLREEILASIGSDD